MKKGVLLAIALSLLSFTTTTAVELGSMSFGFHFSPAVEMQGERRVWDLSMSFGVTIDVDQSNEFEFLVIMDSSPTSLGTSISYRLSPTEPFVVGAGLTSLWAFDSDWKLVGPVIGSFVHATACGNISLDLHGAAGTSFPLVTLAPGTDGWEMLPLVELPSLFLSVEGTVADQLALQGRVTLQPVIVDTTQFEHPLGRITDDLLILPTFSTFVRFSPQLEE